MAKTKLVGTINWREYCGVWNCRLPNNTVLRISYVHLPFSYGTESWLKLQIMTKEGWKDVQSERYKSPKEPPSQWNGDKPLNETAEKHDKKEYELMLYADYIFSYYSTT